MNDPVLEPIPYLGSTVQAFVDRPASHDHMLRAAARRWPRRPAVQSPAGNLTYSELDDAVTSAATALRSNVAAGSHIAVALSHDLALFTVPFVASRAGVTALLLNTSLAPSAWADQLAKVDPAVVIADRDNLAAATQAAQPGGHTVLKAATAWRTDDHAAVTFDDGRLEQTQPDHAPTEQTPTEQTLALIATSGTTGVPKMTRVTSRGLIHAGLAYRHLLGLSATEVSYVCLPLHYIGPLSAQTTAMTLVGGRNIIPSDPQPQGALERMAAAEVTYVDAVPAWLGLLVRDGTHRADDERLRRWRTLIYGGAPMPAATAAVLARHFPALRLWDVWGLSETHGPATALRYDIAAPPLPGTVGRPLPGVEVRTDSDPGRPGELLVRGANVTPGYADDPTLTSQVIDQGWLRTGDIGTVGPDGCVRLLDRAKDVIMRGGANIFSVEVEQILTDDPSVTDAAVYGVTDNLGEEAVMATVVLRPGANLDVMALRTLVDTRVGRHAVPRHITTADSLPRNATGKIDKILLRQQADESPHRS